ncbi:hypothetical protein [Streptomyces sp. NPDC056844]|uniref:hypothetical protein n=1 Tax=unclassified Streptomyces TaxID=2593676 RepID=UPI003683617C
MGIGGATVSDVRDAPEAGAVAPYARPVFVDTTGRRSRTWRRAGAVTALCCVCYATTVTASLVGGDSSAPFLQLPRAMGLERGTGGPSSSVEDAVEDRTASASGPELGVPGAVNLGPLSPGPVRSSAAAPPQPLEPASAQLGTDARSSKAPVVPHPSGPASGGGTQTGADGTEPAAEPVDEPAAEPSSPAPETGGDSGSEAPPAGDADAGAPEAGDTAGPGGQLGDLLGGLLGGLLGSA